MVKFDIIPFCCKHSMLVHDSSMLVGVLIRSEGVPGIPVEAGEQMHIYNMDNYKVVLEAGMCSQKSQLLIFSAKNLLCHR